MATNPGKTNLIAWWELNETSGTRTDSHGSNDLSDNNTVLYAAGKQGNAADFEIDNSEYLSITSSSTLSFGDEDFTIGCWFKAETDVADATLISKWKATTNNREFWLRLDVVGGVYQADFRVSYDGTNDGTIRWTPTLALDTWYFIVAWHDSVANTINIQIDDGTPENAAYSNGCYDNSGNFYLGTRDNTPSILLDGLIDEAFVYNRVLTADERTWLYNSGDGRAYSDLILFTSWDETDAGTGTIEKETSTIYAGVQSAKLTNGVGGANVVKLSQDLTVTDGIKYTLTGYVKGDWQLDIESGANSDTDSGTAADWSLETVEVVADGTSLTVTLQPDGDSDVAYFDAMVVTSYYPADYEQLKFIGTMVDISPSSGALNNPVTPVVAHDWMGYLNKQEIGLQALLADKRVDEVLPILLAEFPNQPEYTDFDTGVEEFEVIFASDSSDSSMARMFAKLARNERGRIFSEGNGTLRFEKQGYRDGSQESAFTIDGTMAEFEVTYTANNIYNTVALDIKTQIIDAVANKELFNVGKGIPIAAGQKITIECNFTDTDTGQGVAGVDVVTPVAAPHFGSARTPASDDMNGNLTHDNYQVGANSLTVDLENGAGVTGYLNEFTILGKRLTDYDRITITKKNQTSIDQIGNSKYTNRLDLIEDPTVAGDIANDILDDYAPSHTAGTRITILANTSDALASQLIIAEPSTKFTAIESITGINKDFYIDHIEYRQFPTSLWITIDASEE